MPDHTLWDSYLPIVKRDRAGQPVRIVISSGMDSRRVTADYGPMTAPRTGGETISPMGPIRVVLLLGAWALGHGAGASAGLDSLKDDWTAYDWYLHGNASFRAEDYDRAVVAFRRSVDLDPGYIYAHANLGVSLAKKQDFEGAIAEFSYCIGKQAGSGADRFVFHLNRALACQQDGQVEAAQRDRVILKRLDPDRATEANSLQKYVLMDSAYMERRNQAARDRFYREAEAAIGKGKVVVRRVPGAGKETEEYEALGLIEGTLEEVSRVLADYGKYPEFMPNVKETVVTDAPDGGIIVDWQLQLPLGVVKKYRLRCWAREEQGRVQRFWKKMPWPGLKPKETIVDTYGQWILEEHPGDKPRVLAYYRIYTDPGDIPFGTGWIVDILTEQSVPDIIRQTKKRVQKISR